MKHIFRVSFRKKKQKNKNTRKIIQVHERKLFFFLTWYHILLKKNNLEKKKFLKKKKSFTWFLFSWGKKSFGWKKTKFWKKKIFVRTRRRSRWTVAKITSLSKLKRGKRLRNADIFFRTAELISSSFIIFLHRPMFTPVLTLQVVAGPRQSPLC